MGVILLGIIAWIAGLLAYLIGLGVLYHQWISRGDLTAVVFSSLFAFALCYWAVYLPVLRLVRRARPPVWVFPVVASLIGIVPTAVIAHFWGGSGDSLFTPEASLFFILFGVVGIVVGLGFTYLDHAE